MNTNDSTLPDGIHIFIGAQADISSRGAFPVTGTELPPLEAGGRYGFSLIVTVPNGHKAIQVHAKREGYTASAPLATDPDGSLVFANQHVPIVGRGKGAQAETGRNDVRVAIVTSTGTLVYWQASIVVQNGKIFLVRQLKTRGSLAKEGGKLTCTAHARPELLRLIEASPDLMANVPTGKVKTAPKAERPLLEWKQGWVAWVDDARQVACLKVAWDHRQVLSVKTSWQFMPQRDGRQCLREGEIVRVPNIQPIVGRQSEFTHEVYGHLTPVDETSSDRKEEPKGFSLSEVDPRGAGQLAKVACK
jgi:hypothetical protein